MTDTTKYLTPADSTLAAPIPRWASDPAVAAYSALATLSAIAVTMTGGGRYGVTLFLLAPLAAGFVAGFVRAWTYRNGRLWATLVATVGLLLPTFALLLFRWEGLICIAMAAPLAFIEALVGSFAGYGIASGYRETHRPPAIMGIVLLMLPVLPAANWMEAQFPQTPPTHIVRSTIDVDAPPEAVWPYVVELPDLPEPTEWFFRAGIGYPLRARTVGDGVGAMRYCDFSTGTFPEIVEVWDAPRVFRFRITAQAPPMKELNPFGDTHPPHLDGHFASERGEFRLEALPGNRTRIHATSWYHHQIAPATYWKLWTDAIIHAIHHRVLSDIKQLSEGS